MRIVTSVSCCVAALKVAPPARPADFRFEHTVRAPVGKVIKFYESDQVLEKLTPPLVPLRTRVKEPIAEGSINSFDLFLRMPWVARHHDVVREPRRLAFTDVQEEGPMRLWFHRHDVAGDDAGTTVVDSLWVEHATPFTRLLFGAPALYALFTYRALATRFYVTGAFL